MNRSPQFLVLVRHGQSVANVLTSQPTDDLYYELTGSDQAVPTTQEGRKQSTLTGSRLSRLFPESRPLDRMHLTRFLRVQESADRIENALGYTIPRTVDPRLEKRSYGDFWNLTYRGVEELHPGEFTRYTGDGKLNYRPPGGENYPDVFARVDSFLEEVVHPSTANRLVVTHAINMLAVQRHFGELTDEEVVELYESEGIPNGHVLIYVREKPAAPWKRFYPYEIGIMGGAFNPIHNRHLVVAECARYQFGLEKVLLVPSGEPPHKSNELLDKELRFEMVEAATAGNPLLEASRIEIDRPGITWTVDTLYQLQKHYGGLARLNFIIGEDNIPTIRDYERKDEILRLARLLVCPRASADDDLLCRWKEMLPKADLQALDCLPDETSSTLVRNWIRAGRSVRYLVPQPVFRILNEKKHYQSTD